MGSRYLVDENGTVIRELSENEFCQIKSQRNVAKWRSATAIKYPFVKTSIRSFSKCAKKYSIFLDIVPYITYIDNSLLFSNGRPLKATNIDTICNLGYKSIQNQIREMTKEDILKRMKIGGQSVLVMNPWICMRGTKVNEDVYGEFKFSAWADEQEE